MNFPESRSCGRRGLAARDDRGATAVEYALMVGLIAVVIVVAVMAFGLSVQGLFESFTQSAPFNN
jgi:pilus assembly protein Flp/PilA